MMTPNPAPDLKPEERTPCEVWNRVITSLIRRLVGSDLWSLIVIAVTQQDGTEKSGSEKREAVITAMRSISPVDVAGWMIGLAIEAAVARLRTQK